MGGCQGQPTLLCGHTILPGPGQAWPPVSEPPGQGWGARASPKSDQGPEPAAGHALALLGQLLPLRGPRVLLPTSRLGHGGLSRSVQGRRWAGRDEHRGHPASAVGPRSVRWEQQVLGPGSGRRTDRRTGLNDSFRTRPLAPQMTLSACGGQGHKSPGGGSQPAPGSSRTSPAPCGIPLGDADPAQRAAPPSDTGQPAARSSRGSAGLPGTPLWSPHAP